MNETGEFKRDGSEFQLQIQSRPVLCFRPVLLFPEPSRFVFPNSEPSRFVFPAGPSTVKENITPETGNGVV